MKFIFKIFNSLIIIFLLFIFLIFLNGFNVYKNTVKDISIEEKINSITHNGYVSIENISDYMKEYIVGVEDNRFYSHKKFY